ncbi:MAG: hypothetical protein ACRDL6_11870 [Solirubrobacterales bacterium]
MRVGKLVAIIALGGALLCSTALAAPGKLVDTGVDGGNPIAFAHGDAFNPKALLIRVSATPQANLEVLSIVTCAKGNKKVKAPDQLFTLFPTAVQKLKKGYKKPTDCTIDVQAAYQDAAIVGDIKVEIFSRAQKKNKKKKKKRKR